MEKKNCKGKGLAKGYGCQKLDYISPMNKGLCLSCWKLWLTKTEEGNNHFHKIFLKVSKQIKYEKAKQKTKGLRELMSVDAYRAKILQPVINEIARLIDHEQPCIATNRTSGKMAGGHRKSVGTNRGIALNLHNIHKQCFESNGYKGGDERNYDAGIVANYGNDYLDFLISIENYTAKFHKHELEQAFEKAKEFRKRLKKDLKKISPKERIELRNQANDYIGLYPSTMNYKINIKNKLIKY